MGVARLRATAARSGILWGIAIFAFCQVVLNVALEEWTPELRDHEHFRKLDRLRAAQGRYPGRPLALFIGSSRTLFGLRPELLAPGRNDGQAPLLFNYGITGQGSPLDELLCLRRLLAEGIRPTWVFLEVMPGLLLKHTDPDKNPTLVPRLSRKDLRLMCRYCPHGLALYEHWCSTRLVPAYSYRFGLMSRAAPAWLPGVLRQDYFDIDEWGRLTTATQVSGAERERMLKEAKEEYYGLLHLFSLPPQTDRAFQELLALCRSHGIRTGLYLMPEGKIYRSWYSPAARTLVDAYLQTLARQWSVPVIDARDWMAEDDFYDSHHLLPRGGTLFSQRLGREALRRLLGSRAPLKTRWAAISTDVASH